MQPSSGQQPPLTSAKGMVTSKARHAAQRQRAKKRARARHANLSDERRRKESNRARDQARECRARARESHQLKSHVSAKLGDGGGAQESNPRSAAHDPQTTPSASISGFNAAGKGPRGDAEEAEQRQGRKRTGSEEKGAIARGNSDLLPTRTRYRWVLSSACC